MTLDISLNWKAEEANRRMAVLPRKLTGKRKVIGRYFGETASVRSLRGYNQLAKGQRNI